MTPLISLASAFGTFSGDSALFTIVQGISIAAALLQIAATVLVILACIKYLKTHR